jgi:hypothetical protein
VPACWWSGTGGEGGTVAPRLRAEERLEALPLGELIARMQAEIRDGV